ncbi:unnamed protein product [Tuber melanosporum]|uniref:(Perigord truffle) hypothetical protein n=1 Tax=Tuber melanosporum (strain Mel28) TaxID=656061 RepID=D5GNY0_TUBMM|nr:uncharacterized protein GSTUM_00011580001 [Tuber melanosporum]CAZ86223.1 unnamed protein product [Tuber melanosporum]
MHLPAEKNIPCPLVKQTGISEKLTSLSNKVSAVAVDGQTRTTSANTSPRASRAQCESTTGNTSQKAWWRAKSSHAKPQQCALICFAGISPSPTAHALAPMRWELGMVRRPRHNRLHHLLQAALCHRIMDILGPELETLMSLAHYLARGTCPWIMDPPVGWSRPRELSSWAIRRLALDLGVSERNRFVGYLRACDGNGECGGFFFSFFLFLFPSHIVPFSLFFPFSCLVSPPSIIPLASFMTLRTLIYWMESLIRFFFFPLSFRTLFAGGRSRILHLSAYIGWVPPFGWCSQSYIALVFLKERIKIKNKKPVFFSFLLFPHPPRLCVIYPLTHFQL